MMREQAFNHEEMRHEVHEDFEHRGHRGHRVLHGATNCRRRLTRRKTAYEHRVRSSGGVHTQSYATSAARFAGRPVAPFVFFAIFVSFVVTASVTSAISVFGNSVFSAA